MNTFRPLYDYVVVRRDEPEKRFGHLIIPDSAQQYGLFATVLAAGRGICNYRNGSWRDLPVKPGDKVIFGYKHELGVKFKLDDEEVLGLRTDSIGAVVDEIGIHPIFDRVLVTRDSGERVSKGGIIIPDTAVGQRDQGTVHAIGSGQILANGGIRPFDLAVGDKVVWMKYAGTEVKYEGKEWLLLREDDVVGVFGEDVAAE